MTPRQLTKTLIALAVVTLLAAPVAALAQQKPLKKGKQNTTRAETRRVVLNVSALRPGDSAMLAVEVEIKPGLHAQSNTPSQPALKKYDLVPDPHPAVEFGQPIFPKGEDHDYGQPLGVLNVYTGTVVVHVPFTVKTDAPLGDITLTGTLQYQICNDRICFFKETPGFEIRSKVVPAGTTVAPNEPDLFKGVDVPAPAPAPPLSRGVPPMTRGGPADPLAPSPEPPSDAPAAEAPPTKEMAQASVRAASAGPDSVKIFGSTLGGDDYLLAFAGAFVVGIIFNIVPCVLPVLPLKAIGFYEVSQHNRAKCLAFGAVFSLGVIASFAVLGLLVLVLQWVKWGEMFSNPWFLGVMVTILVLMAFSMFGVFTVNVPTGLYAISPRHDTYVGNFLFGVLTAVLSTPCTFGMFVGLLTWALTQPPAIGMLMMMTVGAGMSSPYLLLSAFPGMARRFPRTGRWSELVKQMMGFLLLGVAVYFAKPWIERLVRPEAFWWALFAIAVGAAVFLVVRAFQFSPRVTPRLVCTVLAAAVVVSSFAAVRQLTVKPYTWQAYSADALAQARQSNRVVLVEFTASWCTTCHTLEALVLNRNIVVRTVNDHEVVMMKADLSADEAPGWTFLEELKAEGVPLTVIYSPGMAEPIQLVGMYTTGDLRAAIERASEATQVASTAP